ncbi:hypothetical protein M2390_000328 [Mycetocola sp. BIGb0189]|uniref:small multidrug efflux protein n=1 Tax=Mycetocola sp. BIGb0189 TaxID=2940604 RepID=UPI0021688682|nr:small multidrug efflux protein [Mycetocola sp. BIGb0189]MCS4275170.1 hypothetical protein [Mycetocola sp. BIGb0189]
MNNPYEWLQSFIDQVPALLQPVIVAAAGLIPYIEGPGAAALGVLAGINPVVAGIAAALGNVLCVIGVVALGARIRARIVARRTAKTTSGREAIQGTSETSAGHPEAHRTSPNTSAGVTLVETAAKGSDTRTEPRSKGRARLCRWMVSFGVPGASIFAPAALPTMLTAAFFVASGVPSSWVILWQTIAIILWTTVFTVISAGALALLGW